MGRGDEMEQTDGVVNSVWKAQRVLPSAETPDAQADGDGGENTHQTPPVATPYGMEDVLGTCPVRAHPTQNRVFGGASPCAEFTNTFGPGLTTFATRTPGSGRGRGRVARDSASIHAPPASTRCSQGSAYRPRANAVTLTPSNCCAHGSAGHCAWRLDHDTASQSLPSKGNGPFSSPQGFRRGREGPRLP
jgi:hypothetical protein